MGRSHTTQNSINSSLSLALRGVRQAGPSHGGEPCHHLRALSAPTPPWTWVVRVASNRSLLSWVVTHRVPPLVHSQPLSTPTHSSTRVSRPTLRSPSEGVTVSSSRCPSVPPSRAVSTHSRGHADPERGVGGRARHLRAVISPREINEEVTCS